jgi:hypothetical protein
VIYGVNPMDGQSAPRPGMVLIVSLVRLRGGDEQDSAWSLAVIFFECGAEHHLPAVIVMRSRVGNENRGRWDSEHVHMQVGNRAHARDQTGAM